MAKVKNNIISKEKDGTEINKDKSEIDKLVDTIFEEEKLTIENVKKSFKDMCSLNPDNLPEIKYSDGSIVPSYVIAYLFICNEKSFFREAGICDNAKKILAYIDEQSFQDVLLELGVKHIPSSTDRKKIASPICRYANEKTLKALIKESANWPSRNRGNNSYRMVTFREAIVLSELRDAAFFANKYGDMYSYASARNISEDTARDIYLSDVGLDPNGQKQYDLGNQIVTVKLQNDLSYVVELANGKTAKSLPKKGADEELYVKANKDFSSMKKDSKKIISQRVKNLFDDYLGGRERKADEWLKSYENNPLLNHVARTLVWCQNGKTFAFTDDGYITSDEKPYQVGTENIKLAHPIEMKNSDITQWQKYFTSHGIKQPFEQIWEPIIDFENLKKDRYHGCSIPLYRFMNQEKRGISCTVMYEGAEIDIESCHISFLDFTKMANGFMVIDEFFVNQNVSDFEKRRINNLVAYLDRIAIYGLIEKDDMSVMDSLYNATLAQIMSYIKEATDDKSKNVLSALLDYKNEHFADYNPMDEFTFDI